jgi:hypothetical protein
MIRKLRNRNHLSLSRVNHDIVRANVSMHYAFAMGKLQSFHKFFNVISDIFATESGVQTSEVDVFHVFEDQGW